MNNFSIRRVLQILFYIQNSHIATSKTKSYMMYLLKIVFFADRYHLRNYGLTVSGDVYFAMGNGPVASATKDVLQGQMPSNSNSAESSLLNEVEETGEYSVELKSQQEDELSDSMKEALDFALNNFGSFSQFELSDMTHDYPEWKKHEEALKSGAKRVGMNLVDFFEDPSELKYLNKNGIMEDPFCDDIDFLNDMKEKFSNEVTF